MNAYKSQHISNQSERTHAISENSVFINKRDSKMTTNNNEEINGFKEINVIVVKKKIDLYDKKEINGLQVIRETKQTTIINGINVLKVVCRKPLCQYIDL